MSVVVAHGSDVGSCCEGGHLEARPPRDASSEFVDEFLHLPDRQRAMTRNCEHAAQNLRFQRPVSRFASAARGSLEIAHRPRSLAAPERHLTAEEQRVREPRQVLRRLEDANCVLERSSHRRMARMRVRVEEEKEVGDRRVRDDPELTARLALLRRLRQQRPRAFPLALIGQRPAEHRQEGEASCAVWREESLRPPEKIRRGRQIAALVGPPAGRSEVATRTLREVPGALGLGAELGETRVSLLEVVADDLLELLAASVEPAGEALVEVGAQRFRDAVVRRVANEHVAEAERVVDRLVGTDQLLAHESCQPCARMGAGRRLRARRGPPTRSRDR